MAMEEGVKTHPDYPVPETMKAWVLGDPGQRRDRGPAIEMLEEINGEHWAAAEPARPADHQTSEV